jgi:tetratricopeptide (TPR) repeat protein
MADSAVKRLGEAIDIQKYPNESAIIKMHLAILDEQLADHVNALDLGRFYLRIAWVFRCMDSSDDPNKLLLGSLLRELDTRYHAFGDAVSTTRESFDALSSSIMAQFESDQLSADMQSIMYGYRDRFGEQSQSMRADLEAVTSRLQQFTELLHEYRLAVLGSETGEGVKSFKSHRSFPEFLRTLTGWNGIVSNEREALEKAIHYYREAYANGRDIAPGTQQIQASYLIAELSRRIGDYDQAKQFFTSTIKSGQEFIYENRRDQSRTALARKILELAIEQGRVNLAASKPA